jgi:hypothetical protein
MAAAARHVGVRARQLECRIPVVIELGCRAERIDTVTGLARAGPIDELLTVRSGVAALTSVPLRRER